MFEHELTIEKINGQKIVGKIFIPEKGLQKYPAVIFSHGFNENYRQLEHHAADYAESGIASIMFDFCGGGTDTLSDGRLDQMTILTEADDLEAVIDAVLKLDFIDSDRLFLHGDSMGGFISAYVAARLPELIRALVLWYPAFVIPDDAKRRIETGDNICFGLEISPDFARTSDIDIFGIISKYTGPVKIIHGDKDPVVPYTYSERAVSVYKDAELTILSGAGHGFGEEDDRTARAESIEFIKSYI